MILQFVLVFRYNFYNMLKQNQISKHHSTLQNTYASTSLTQSQPITDLLSQFHSVPTNKHTFDKMDFNFKKTSLKLKSNNSSSLHLFSTKLTESDRRDSKLQTNLLKPPHLSSLHQKNTPKSISSLYFINTPKSSSWAQLELRKTQSSQTDSSMVKSVLFGNKIADFKLLKLLGKGRFGEVFLAMDKRSGFMGAIKMLRKAQIGKLQAKDREKMVSQLSNQIKIQLSMEHPNIIKLYTFFHDSTSIYLFLQLGTDGHLLDILERYHHLQEQTTSVTIRQITRGLRYMHSRHIIHRDIKLENIVLTCGMAKICDFGWATYQTKSLRQTICGTPIYLSPEILKGKKYNHKIDIWAIGTIAHELAVGDNPFKVRRKQDLQNIVNKDFEMTVGSLQLRSFISFILRKEPQRRPDAQILMKHPFITKYKHIQTAQQLWSVSH